MVTLAQRMQALRTEKNLSRPALAAALGLPRTSIEKFEAGRQTPTQEQQKKLAALFGVSLAYLRGETDDRTDMTSWLSGGFDEPDVPAVPAKSVPSKATVVQSAGDSGEGAVFSALLKSPSFRAMVKDTVLEVLRSPEGQALLAKAAQKK